MFYYLEVKFYFSPVKISSQLNRSSMKSRIYILILIIHMYLSIKDPVWCCIPNQMHGLVTWCWRLSPAPAHVTRAAVTSLRNLDPLPLLLLLHTLPGIPPPRAPAPDHGMIWYNILTKFSASSTYLLTESKFWENIYKCCLRATTAWCHSTIEGQ